MMVHVCDALTQIPIDEERTKVAGEGQVKAAHGPPHVWQPFLPKLLGSFQPSRRDHPHDMNQSKSSGTRFLTATLRCSTA